MDIKTLLGKRIREIRKSKHLTQERVAEIINIEPASLSNIENGKYYPTAENIQKIANVLDVNISELYTFEHLDKEKVLIEEMTNGMAKNPDLTRLMYKFYKTVK